MENSFKIFALIAVTGMIFISLSCKEYEFSSPYDKQNTISAPAGLSFSFLADTAVSLNWQYEFQPEFNIAFEIEVSEDGTSYSLLKTINENVKAAVIEHNFVLNKEYYFRISALAGTNRSDYNTANGKILFEAPGNVTAELPTDTVAVIRWQDNSTAEDGFEIFMSIDGGAAAYIKELPANSTQAGCVSDYFTGHTYTFSVRAKSGKFGFTSFASTNSQFNLMQVTGLNVTIPNSTTANLTWTNGSGYAREIVIEQSTDGNNYSFVKNVSPTSTAANVDGNYQYNNTYYYRIKTNTKNNTGNYSLNNSQAPFICGTTTVIYSDKTYNTVQIGSQCWLKENLNVGTRINGSANPSNNGTIEKYCYDNNEANCKTYGGLYTWDEAMQYSTTSGTRGICPPGWHIPTNAEFQTLATSVGNNGNALKAVGQGTGSGTGTNTSGFSALLAGYRSINGYFVSLTYDAYFWSSTEYSSTNARYVSLNYNDSGIYFDYYSKENGFSIRCSKD